MLTLEQVRLTKYPDTTELPAGFKWLSERKEGDKKIVPFPWNWYGRYNSAKHFVFHKLALANQDPTNYGVTVAELKAALPEAEHPVVDEIVSTFKAGTQTRPTGWDMISNEDGTKLALVYRDPRVHFAQEAKMAGDHSQIAETPAPGYISKIPAMIEEAKNPKPKAEPKEAKPRKGKSADAPAAASTSAPAGGYLKAYNDYGIKVRVDALGGDLSLANVIDQFVLADAEYTPKGSDTKRNVKADVLTTIDQNGLEASVFIDFLAQQQRDGGVKAGMYKICKDLAAKYNEAVKAGPPPAATAAPVTPAANPPVSA